MDPSPSSNSVSSSASSACSSSHYATVMVSCAGGGSISESASSDRLLPPARDSVSVQGRHSARAARRMAIASLAVSVLCVAGVVAVALWLTVLSKKGDLLPLDRVVGKGEEVCVPCVQISPSPLLSPSSSPSPLWAGLDVRGGGLEGQGEGGNNDTEDEMTCCASTPAQFALLFKLILQRQQAVKKLADALESETKKNLSDVTADDLLKNVTQLGVSAVSAHLLFKPDKSAKAGQARQPKWKSPSESPLSHVKAGLSLHNNGIVVSSPGRYFVYLQVLFSPSSSPSAHSVASAYVERFSILRPSASGLLLKTRHTRHDVTEDRHSSYVGAVYHLHRGDWLYVKVSDPDLLSHDDVGTFFGLFRVGD
ncbi:uncharacterized protein LOC143289190 [Babylonia areolata]|uniref:uncharacterized protein LOC143289190 n=1 Tax=Babylonia areolata TaxID=304850 RepID=UPI003FD5B4FC